MVQIQVLSAVHATYVFEGSEFTLICKTEQAIAHKGIPTRAREGCRTNSVRQWDRSEVVASAFVSARWHPHGKVSLTRQPPTHLWGRHSHKASRSASDIPVGLDNWGKDLTFQRHKAASSHFWGIFKIGLGRGNANAQSGGKEREPEGAYGLGMPHPA